MTMTLTDQHVPAPTWTAPGLRRGTLYDGP